MCVTVSGKRSTTVSQPSFHIHSSALFCSGINPGRGLDGAGFFSARPSSVQSPLQLLPFLFSGVITSCCFTPHRHTHTLPVLQPTRGDNRFPLSLFFSLSHKTRAFRGGRFYFFKYLGTAQQRNFFSVRTHLHINQIWPILVRSYKKSSPALLHTTAPKTRPLRNIFPARLSALMNHYLLVLPLNCH